MNTQRVWCGVIACWLLASPSEFVGTAFAQTGLAPRSMEAALALRGEALENARRLALSGDDAGAERVLADSVAGAPGDAVWHFDAASALSTLAGRLLETGHAQVVRAVAGRAIDHFVTAAELTNQSKLRGSAWAAAGALCERYFGDAQSAKLYYRSALAADNRSKGPMEALRRLDSADRVKTGASRRKGK